MTYCEPAKAKANKLQLQTPEYGILPNGPSGLNNPMFQPQKQFSYQLAEKQAPSMSS